MEKIDDFRIVELTVSGFKGFAERKVFGFDYGVNFLLGDNGQGKTSIAEAIAFAFMGTGFYGEKTLDRLQNKAADEAFVSVKFTDGDGELHELTKMRKNNATAITYDGYTVRQTELCNLFGDKDLFLSMFNPLYFAETLGADGKNLLEKLLPAVSHEQVLVALPEDARNALHEENILSPEVYIKNRRAEIRELEENMIYLQGQVDLLEDGAKKAQTALAQTQAALAEKNALLQELRKFLPSEDEKARLRAELQALENPQTTVSQSQSNLQDSILDTKLRLMRAKESAFVFAEDAEIQRLEAELKLQYARYDALSKRLHEIRDGWKCGTCRHEMTERDVLAARAELKHELEQCVAEGKAKKAELKNLQQRKETQRRAFLEKQAAEVVALEERLAELEIHYHSMTEKLAAESTATADRREQLQAMLNYGRLSPEQIEQFRTLQQECRDLSNELHRLEETQQQPDLSAQLVAIRQEVDAKKRLVDYAFRYIGKKNELLFSPLQMNRVQLTLSEVMKGTGEVKDTFKFTYDGKDYTRLSLSEKMRAGLELAELVKRLSGRCYPTFLDNGESVSVIDNVRPTGQLMIAKVTRGRALTILTKNGSERKAA